MSNNAVPLLEIKNLKKWFPVKKKPFEREKLFVKAVNGVNLTIMPGETLGLVGESGCGKSTLSRMIMGLETKTEGEILFDGVSYSFGTEGKKQLYRQVKMVFQNPYASLNPRMRIGKAIAEPLVVNHMGSKGEIDKRVKELLDMVGIPADYANRFPHELSGGQRQRVAIARALSINPRLLICDEPVSALDVSIRSQILNLLADLNRELNLTTLFISHDLSVVEYLCDRVAVMYLGRIMEISPAKELFARPSHPYTQALFSAIPVPDPHASRARITLSGDVPTPVNSPAGCGFLSRCPYAAPECANEPVWDSVGEGHCTACRRHGEIAASA